MIRNLDTTVASDLPPWSASIDQIHQLSRQKGCPADVLRAASDSGLPALQPRCGVGAHEAMKDLLVKLETHASPEMLTLTIDSHTRLRRFDVAARTLCVQPANLNGYPLVSHGWRRGLELNEAVRAPLEIRHGSPDPRELFAVSIAAGITSFEGGGISYNLPYSKDVSLEYSLAAWREVDRACGLLAREGVIVDREMFGTLTAVLVPPAVSLAITMLEAMAAAQEDVRCISIAYPQNGEIVQDVAALRAILPLARRYLPEHVEVFAVLHEFMGAFPCSEEKANALIFYGGLVGRLGGAAKIITKTNQEAYGIPDASANVHGLRTAALARSRLLDFITIDEALVEEEMDWLTREVADLVEPVLAAGIKVGLSSAICDAFRRGTLDIPFSASVHARSEVIPKRDARGAIRFLSTGGLPFSEPVLRRNRALVGEVPANSCTALKEITNDINYFCDAEGAAYARDRRFIAQDRRVRRPG